jgi:hypothetical protein
LEPIRDWEYMRGDRGELKEVSCSLPIQHLCQKMD